MAAKQEDTQMTSMPLRLHSAQQSDKHERSNHHAHNTDTHTSQVSLQHDTMPWRLVDL